MRYFFSTLTLLFISSVAFSQYFAVGGASLPNSTFKSVYYVKSGISGEAGYKWDTKDSGNTTFWEFGISYNVYGTDNETIMSETETIFEELGSFQMGDFFLGYGYLIKPKNSRFSFGGSLDGGYAKTFSGRVFEDNRNVDLSFSDPSALFRIGFNGQVMYEIDELLAIQLRLSQRKYYVFSSSVNSTWNPERTGDWLTTNQIMIGVSVGIVKN